MRIGARTGVGIVVATAGLWAAACGGGGRGGVEQAATHRAIAEVVAPLKAPESPYYIIYYPPVDLAKRPDTSKAAPGFRNASAAH